MESRRGRSPFTAASENQEVWEVKPVTLKAYPELVSLALGPKQLQCTDILDPTLPDLSQYKKVNGSLLVASINITSGQGDRGVSWGRVTIGAELTIYKCGRARWKLE